MQMNHVQLSCLSVSELLFLSRAMQLSTRFDMSVGLSVKKYKDLLIFILLFANYMMFVVLSTNHEFDKHEL